MDDVGRLKERAKTVWALGDYPAVARRFEAVADEVVAACGTGPGQRVLDVAAGNGEWNRADDGSVRLPAAYLRAVGRRG